MSQTGLNCYMRYLNGENNVLEEFVSTYSDALIRYAYCYVQDTALAEDVMEETIATLVFRQKHFQDENHLQAYLYRVIRNKSIDHLRKRKKEVSLSDIEDVLYGNDVESKVIRESCNQQIRCSEYYDVMENPNISLYKNSKAVSEFL